MSETDLATDTIEEVQTSEEVAHDIEVQTDNDIQSALYKKLMGDEPEEESVTDDAVPDEPSVDEESAEPVGKDALEPIPMPKTWKAEDAQTWAQLPPEVQKTLADREASASLAVQQKLTAVEQERRQAQAERQQYAQVLSQHETVMRYELNKLYAGINWNELAETQPDQYIKLSHQYNQDLAEFNQVMAEQERVKDISKQEHIEVAKSALQQEAVKLAKAIPDFRDPVKSQSMKKEMAEYLRKTVNATDEDIYSLSKAEPIILIHKAMMYDKTMAEMKKSKVVSPPKTVTHGVKASVDDRGSADMKKLTQQQRNNGDTKSTQALLEARLLAKWS